MALKWIKWFEEVGSEDVDIVGGKNASLGEMVRTLGRRGVRVPPGFAVTAEGYRHFLEGAGIESRIDRLLNERDCDDHSALTRCSDEVRRLIMDATFPSDLRSEIEQAYAELGKRAGAPTLDVAVRSSATAEDLPTASFAGQLESFLNVNGVDDLVDSVRRSYASLFGARVINYREDLGFDHGGVAVSAGVQQMVRSDLATAGVVFTLEPESGHRGVILVTSSWGLGESVVQGLVAPDQFTVHKATLAKGYEPIVWRRIGTKESRIVYDERTQSGVRSESVSKEDRARPSLSDADILTLARAALAIEEHYRTPMDIEWAKDGRTGEVFIVQARPETVHSQRPPKTLEVFHQDGAGKPIVSGQAVGERIASGKAHVIRSPTELGDFRPGEILVTATTDPDWEPIMKTAAGIVTERGGRTSHAAIIARELGLPAIVGATDAMRKTTTGEVVTVSCSEGETGVVYQGEVPFHIKEIDLSSVPKTRTQMMLNVANPERAFGLSLLPSDGVGLARMEFIIANWVRAHPLALTRFSTLSSELQKQVEAVTQGHADKSEYFVDRLSQGIGTLAAAFHPRPVILRFSDFKTNEYSQLLGGADFEPHEENPMLGWRGASRYYHPDYREGFELELAAVRRVREQFGLMNLKVMIPFCRTPEEGRRVLKVMSEAGLSREKHGLEVYVMAELPTNILLAEEFARDFDGFSIGSNDLTQLTLGLDRDSATVAHLFDELNAAVLWSCAHLIKTAHASGRKVGICGQAPSDHPEFAAFVVSRGIDSISLMPDAILRTTRRVAEAERGSEPAEAQTPALH